MPAQSPGTLINAGMPGVELPAKDAACAAFSAAVDLYCAPDERERRKNKYQGKDRTPIKDFKDFFKEQLEKGQKKQLQNENPPATESLALTGEEREIALNLLPRSGGGPAASASKKSQAMLADDRDASKGSLRGSAASGKTHGATAIKIKSKFGDRFGGGTKVFPDGELQDQAIELKGPGDTEDPKGKFNKHQQVKKDEKAIVVSCRSCGQACKKGNSC